MTKKKVSRKVVKSTKTKVDDVWQKAEGAALNPFPNGFTEPSEESKAAAAKRARDREFLAAIDGHKNTLVTIGGSTYSVDSLNAFMGVLVHLHGNGASDWTVKEMFDRLMQRVQHQHLSDSY